MNQQSNSKKKGITTTQKQFNKWICKPCKWKDTKRKKDFYFADKKDHSFELVDNMIRCRCCATMIDPYKSAQHMGGEKHERAIMKWINKQAKVQETLHNIEQKQATNNLPTQSLPSDVKLFRYDWLRAAYKAGISMNQLQKLRPTVEEYSKLPLGNAELLPSLYDESLFDDLVGQIKGVLKQSYNCYGVITDGTPSFAKIEAIAIRLVTKT